MKRKNILNLIFLVVLIVAAAIILVNNKNKTIPEGESNFSVSDTASITKIFIADQNRNKVVLSRKGKDWFVNDEYKANPTRINLLLDVLKKVEMKNPAPENFKQSVINDIATFGKKVEIYTNKNKAYKSFYVGGPTQDEKGTYFKMAKDGTTPYVVHIPGWEGYLTDGYFFVEENEWRTKTVFDFKPINIKEIEVKNNIVFDNDFKIMVESPEKFSILKNNETIDSIDNRKVINYLSGFENLQFVELGNNLKKSTIDSINNEATPIYNVSVTTINNKVVELKLYFKPATKQTRVEFPIGYDKEYLLGIVSTRPEDILIMQTLTSQRILWNVEDFKIKK